MSMRFDRLLRITRNHIFLFQIFFQGNILSQHWHWDSCSEKLEFTTNGPELVNIILHFVFIVSYPTSSFTTKTTYSLSFHQITTKLPYPIRPLGVDTVHIILPSASTSITIWKLVCPFFVSKAHSLDGYKSFFYTEIPPHFAQALHILVSAILFFSLCFLFTSRLVHHQNETNLTPFVFFNICFIYLCASLSNLSSTQRAFQLLPNQKIDFFFLVNSPAALPVKR